MPRRSSTEDLEQLLAELPAELREQAFTHASWVEHRSQCYERLSFLGDVVLSLAVSNHLFPRFESYGAGRLTKVRAQAVSGAACARVARGLGVPAELRAAAPEGTGRSAEMLVESERVLASICEAIIGAAYLAFGIGRTAPAVVASFAAEIDEALEHPVDYKSVLQERLARRAEAVAYRHPGRGRPAARPLVRGGRRGGGAGAGARGRKDQEERRAGGRASGARGNSQVSSR